MNAQPVEMRIRRAELLDDVASQTVALLSEFGLAGDVATHVGHALADHIADHWGGQVLSIPKDASYKLSERERTILAEHRTGATIAALATKYGLSERGMRKLLKRALRRDVHFNQGQLQFEQSERGAATS